MKPVVHFAILMLTLSGFACAQNDLQADLRKEVENSTRTIRNFYDDNDLRYDATGNFLGHSGTGPWTIYGRVFIHAVKLKDDKLELFGQRQIMFYDKDQKKLAPANWKDKLVRIEIASPPGAGRRDQLHAALRQVFINPDEDFSGTVPDYWLFYASGGKDGTCGRSKDSASSSSIPAPQTGDSKTSHQEALTSGQTDQALPIKVRVSQGVLEGAKIKDHQPIYPLFAKLAHIQGDVVMAASIDKSGNIAGLCIRQPAGGGLDEAAADAVKQWKYRPYLLKGEPVAVETVITVRFHM